jgi:hypothetical protein
MEMERYELTDNKSGEKFTYTKLQWELAFYLIFFAGLLTGLSLGYYCL